jgi:hypothetical protein
MPVAFVYQSVAQRIVRAAAALGMAALGIAAGFGVFGLDVIDRTIIGIGGVLAVIFVLPRALKRLTAPQPAIGLDETGIEGDFGFLPWSAVTAVEIVRRPKRFGLPSLTRVVRFNVKPGTSFESEPRATYGPIALAADWEMPDDALELGLWTRRSRVLDELRPYLPALLLDAR